ncbi:MAG: arsenate reductase ArsC [Pirellulales bacterium]
MNSGKPGVLFLCTGNSARSQMAEGLLRAHGGDLFEAYSAGTEPKGLNPLAVQALAERGIDIRAQRSKHVSEFLGKLAVQHVIIVCGDADRRCPSVWPGVLRREFWPFEDPAAATGSEVERLEKFRQVRDQIEARLLPWLEEHRALTNKSNN